jgi:hypothetical protein
MRLTIIKEDGFVSVDNDGYKGIDLSRLDESIHAVQWYDTYGEVEIKDSRNRIIENKEIANIDDYLFVITLWQAKKDEAIENENRSQAELPTT